MENWIYFIVAYILIGVLNLFLVRLTSKRKNTKKLDDPIVAVYLARIGSIMFWPLLLLGVLSILLFFIIVLGVKAFGYIPPLNKIGKKHISNNDPSEEEVVDKAASGGAIAKNDVTAFFYYMWNEWNEKEAAIIFSDSCGGYKHYWNKWVHYSEEYGHRSAVDLLYGDLDESNRNKLVKRALDWCDIRNSLIDSNKAAE